MPSFFPSSTTSTAKQKKGPSTKAGNYSLKFLHQHQCRVCPLNDGSAISPHMEPTGEDRPDIYILGEAPGREEDEQAVQFVGEAGRVLRHRIPRKYISRIRFNNCVRTRPPNNKTPEYLEIECCRPSIVKDIEKTKPRIIIGLGNIPLNWMINRSGISLWSGRLIPVQVGSHKCWFFPTYHPSYISRERKGRTPRSKEDYPSEQEFAFARHLDRALKLSSDLSKPKIHTREKAFQNVEIITGEKPGDLKRLLKFFDSIKEGSVVGLDYETNGLRPYREGAKILTVAMSTKHRTVAYALYHREAKWSASDIRTIEARFRQFLTEDVCIKAVHRLGFELEWSAVMYGNEVIRAQDWSCTMSQAYILDERQGSGVLSLDGLCVQHFGIDIKALNPVNRKDLDNAPLEDVLWYNGIDSKYHRLLHNRQRKLLKQERLTPQHEHNVDRIKTLTLTQLKGLPVDQKVVDKFYKTYTNKLERTDLKISEMKVVGKFQKKFGRDFRPSSNHDVKKMVTEILGHDVPNVGEGSLAKVKHPISKLILRRRSAAKLLSTYVLPVREGSPYLINGRIHPIFDTCSTRTWRTSSDSINAQNWPKRENVEIRSQIKPKRGYKIVAFDYAGIQARNVAMESKDENLVAAFNDHYDIHSDWLEQIVKTYPKWIKGGTKKLRDKDVFKKYRNRAKNEFVFPKFFGAMPKKVSIELGIPEHLAEDLSEEFWDRFPKIKGWHDWLEQFYREHGCVTGLSGFRRRAPIEPNKIINAPIQADESIIVLDAMIRLSEMEDDAYQASIEIHDDLTFIWPEKKVDEYAETVISMMLDVPFEWAHIVPLGVEMSIGDDWGHLETVGEWFTDTWKGSIHA